jgi:alkylation response protein AidB-like acyl-CoA dehydrogenase
MVKSFVTDLAVPTNLLCMNIMGAYGVTAEYNVERYLRDSLIGPHIEGVSDVQRVIAANYILNTNDPLV